MANMIQGRENVINAIYAELRTAIPNFVETMLSSDGATEVSEDTFIRLLPKKAAMSPADVQALVAIVKHEHDIPSDDHPFGDRREEMAIYKGLYSLVKVPGDKNSFVPLTDVQKQKILDDRYEPLAQHHYFQDKGVETKEQRDLLFSAIGLTSTKEIYQDIIDEKTTAKSSTPKGNGVPPTNPNPTPAADTPNTGKNGNIAALVAGGAALLLSLYNLITGSHKQQAKDGEEAGKEGAEAGQKKGPGFLTIAGVTVGSIVTGLAIYAMYQKKPIGQVFNRTPG